MRILERRVQRVEFDGKARTQAEMGYRVNVAVNELVSRRPALFWVRRFWVDMGAPDWFCSAGSDRMGVVMEVEGFVVVSWCIRLCDWVRMVISKWRNPG
jgi:hypothetical protein